MTRRPTCSSVCSPKPAKVSIWRASSFFWSGVGDPRRDFFGRLVARRPAGIDAHFLLAGEGFFAERVPAVVELPLYAIYSFGTWCGACGAPVAKYMKKGLSGVSECWACIQAMALSVMSTVKW